MKNPMIQWLNGQLFSDKNPGINEINNFKLDSISVPRDVSADLLFPIALFLNLALSGTF